jgi:serine/threonine-protein kinase
MSLSIGQLIGERYRLIRKIAVGGMGEVWEAADTRLGRRVAVKVLKSELSGSTEFLQRFRVEARTTASLNHPGIAAVHDYGETSNGPDGPAATAYLVMELVEGEPLAAMIARRRRLTPDRTLDVLEQAGHALQAAHQRGLVHRDVKPGNILLTGTGTVKLTDFGIAKAVDAAPVTRSGMVMGTAHYIAPEQAMGQEAGPASDVYSLGVVGYECLTGHRPFRSDSAVTVAMMHIRDTPPPLPPDTPPGVRALIDATLVKDPRARYATGGEFAAAVAAVRAGRPLPRPGSAALQVPPSRSGVVLGVPPLLAGLAAQGGATAGGPGIGGAGIAGGHAGAGGLGNLGAGNVGGHGNHGGLPEGDDTPTGPQPRLGMPRGAVVTTGEPATPIAPGGHQFVPPRPPLLPHPHRQLEPRVGLWLLIGLLVAATIILGGWGLVTLLADGTGGGAGHDPAGRAPRAATVSQRKVTPGAVDYPGYPAKRAASGHPAAGPAAPHGDPAGPAPASATTYLVTGAPPADSGASHGSWAPPCVSGAGSSGRDTCG